MVTCLNSIKYSPSSHLVKFEAWRFIQSWYWCAETQSRLLFLIAHSHQGICHNNTEALLYRHRALLYSYNQRWLPVAVIAPYVWEQKQNSGMQFITVKEMGLSIIKDEKNISWLPDTIKRAMALLVGHAIARHPGPLNAIFSLLSLNPQVLVPIQRPVCLLYFSTTLS